MRIDLTGALYVDEHNITSVTFRAIPDVPIRRFDLVRPEGARSILAASARASVLAGVLITVLSDVPARLPGIALDSTALFVAERGVSVIAVLIFGITLVGRTLKRELPTGFSATTGSVMYAATVAEATTSSETAGARLETRLDKQDANLSDLNETVDELVNNVAEIRGGAARSGWAGSKPTRKMS